MKVQPAKKAGYQGFDDGYFRNPRQQHFASAAEKAVYDAEFANGERQRDAADKAATRRRAFAA